MRASSGKTEPFCGKTEPAPTVYPVDALPMRRADHMPPSGGKKVPIYPTAC